MTLEQLRIFIEVAALEHVTRAAEKLHMTPSAVSAAIQALETRHAVTLFDRVGRSIELNGNGRRFLDQAERVLASARAAEAALMDLSGLADGALTIAASRTVGTYWLLPRLAVYRRRHPGIRLQVAIANSAEVGDAVQAGRAELGLIEWPGESARESAGEAASELVEVGDAGKAGWRRGVVLRQFAGDEMIVVVAPDHPWAGRRTPVSDLTESRWVLREPGSGTRDAFHGMLRQWGVDRRRIDIELVLPANEAVLGAVEAGLGATLISRSVAVSALRLGQVVEAPIAPQSRPYFLLHHGERYRSKAAQAFEALVFAPSPV